MTLSIPKINMVNRCEICSSYEAIVECAKCHKGNCAIPFVCCFTFAYTEDTLMVVCHECYTEIEHNLIPLQEKKKQSKKKKKRQICHYAHYSPVVMM